VRATVLYLRDVYGAYLLDFQNEYGKAGENSREKYDGIDIVILLLSGSEPQVQPPIPRWTADSISNF
jgi:hypothetical protein